MYYIVKINVVATNTPLKSTKVSELLLGWSYSPGGLWFGGCVSYHCYVGYIFFFM